MDGRFFVYIDSTLVFFIFVLATITSLVIGHVMCGVNRFVNKTGEWGVPAEYGGGGPRRLCNVLRPPGFHEGRAYAYGPVVAISVSLALLLVGIFIDVFEFVFEGLAGYILGSEDSVRRFSVMTLAYAIPSGFLDPTGIRAYALQFAFIMFAAVLAVSYQSLLLVLWTAPMSERLHRHFLVATQTLNAWNG